MFVTCLGERVEKNIFNMLRGEKGENVCNMLRRESGEKYL